MSLWRENPKQWLVERLNRFWRELMSGKIEPDNVSAWDAKAAVGSLRGGYVDVSMRVGNLYGAHAGGEWGWEQFTRNEAPEKARSMATTFYEWFFFKRREAATTVRRAILNISRHNPVCALRADELLRKLRETPVEPSPHEAFRVLEDVEDFLQNFDNREKPKFLQIIDSLIIRIESAPLGEDLDNSGDLLDALGKVATALGFKSPLEMLPPTERKGPGGTLDDDRSVTIRYPTGKEDEVGYESMQHVQDPLMFVAAWAKSEGHQLRRSDGTPYPVSEKTKRFERILYWDTKMRQRVVGALKEWKQFLGNGSSGDDPDSAGTTAASRRSSPGGRRQFTIKKGPLLRLDHSQGFPVALVGNRRIAMGMEGAKVLEALIRARPDGLTKDELFNKSGIGDPLGVLKRLAKKPGFKKAIRLAGMKGGRYRVL